MRKRIIVILATVAVFAAVLGLSRMAAQPSMSLLYAGLEAGPAGEVIGALEAQGAVYEVRGGAIYVDGARRDELRMTLASEGLPANNAQGYELLDGLSGFGTTSQMFDAAYWRAKEGELARTIVASPHIRHARVHIANQSTQGLRNTAVPTASVTVTTASGSLSASHAKALKYLVASAVAGMTPENVSVIDGRGGLVMSGDELAVGGADGADRAVELKRNVERLLEARVGYGNAVVEISVETATERESITERRFDPESRVAISTDTVESTNSASDSRGGGVTVASNLPDGDTAGGNGSSSSSNSELRERVNYEVSETTREVLRNPGAVRRVSVAVLVDGLKTVNEDGQEIWAPRPQEELEALRELVASAVGFDAERGDTITIKSLEFEPIVAEGSGVAPSLLQRLNLDVMSLIQVAVLGLVTLVLGMFVIRPILSQVGAAAAPGELPAPATPPALPGMAPAQGTAAAQADVPALPGAPAGGDFPALPALSGEIDGAGFAPPKMGVVSDFDFGDDDGGGPDLNDLDPVDRLKAMIEERQEETVEILRGWMENSEESA